MAIDHYRSAADDVFEISRAIKMGQIIIHVSDQENTKIWHKAICNIANVDLFGLIYNDIALLYPMAVSECRYRNDRHIPGD